MALDWMDNNCSDDSPVILLLPGLTGASQSEYIKCLVTAACDIGARVVVFNNRGLGGVALKVSQFESNHPIYVFIGHFALPADATTVLCGKCGGSVGGGAIHCEMLSERQERCDRHLYGWSGARELFGST